MLDRGIRHLPVLAPRGELIGVVTDVDLLWGADADTDGASAGDRRRRRLRSPAAAPPPR